eukprot:c55932_g1_i1.p1 GENE.c55932_g1_i1~~c55932_g1_i1.p1  ORF type:complete len:166 (+),score=24.79 c55932_g1_i1:41-538(+)
MSGVKQEICAYSGLKIYPGHGVRYIRVDSKVHIFLNSKSILSFKMKRNPRKIAWTVFYRRLHKKDQTMEVNKRKSRKATKAPRAIVGASIEAIKAKRNQPESVREAARAAVLQEVKAQKKKAAEKKKAESVKTAGPSGGKAAAAVTKNKPKDNAKAKTGAKSTGR